MDGEETLHINNRWNMSYLSIFKVISNKNIDFATLIRTQMKGKVRIDLNLIHFW